MPSPSCFDVRNIAEAQAIILTAEDSTTAQRWKTETPYLANLIGKQLDLGPLSRVLDYGCGIGRLAKALIDRHGCQVIGVDTSMSMRALAPAYVLDERFLACAPCLLGTALRPVTSAIAVWALQHIPDLEGALSVIHRQMVPSGRLFVVNGHVRALPTPDGPWVNDGKDVRALLRDRFEEIAHGSLSAESTTPLTAKASFWGVYQRRNS